MILELFKVEKKIETNGKLTKQIDKALNEVTDQIVRRFDSVIDKFENVDKVVEEHIDTIADLEVKCCDITKSVTFMKELLKKVKDNF